MVFLFIPELPCLYFFLIKYIFFEYTTQISQKEFSKIPLLVIPCKSFNYLVKPRQESRAIFVFYVRIWTKFGPYFLTWYNFLLLPFLLCFALKTAHEQIQLHDNVRQCFSSEIRIRLFHLFKFPAYLDNKLYLKIVLFTTLIFAVFYK